MAGSSAQWSIAEANAHLGFTTPAGRGRRLLKRVVGKLLWPFLRQQITYNGALLGELETVASRLDAVEARVTSAQADLEHHSTVLTRHEDPLNRHEVGMVQMLSGLEEQQRKAAGLGDHMNLVNDALEELQQKQAIVALETKDAVRDLLRQVDVMKDQINLGYRQVVTQLQDAVTEVRNEVDDLRRDLGSEIDKVSDRHATWGRNLGRVWEQLAQLDVFLARVRGSFPDAPSLEDLASVPRGYETLYPMFEDAFRGPEDVIKDRVRQYLDDLEQIPAGLPVVDLGCGRGELLAVLAEKGIASYGVDSNPKYLSRGAERGLDVRLGDVIEHLREVKPRSLGAVTAIHIVEHLPLNALIELIELSALALAPGGILILETPNPENLSVGADTFYLDPTHLRPLPPPLLAFLVETQGFPTAEVRRLRRAEQPPELREMATDDPLAHQLNRVIELANSQLLAPADYAVIGKKS